MKTGILLTFNFLATMVFAQTAINQTYALKPGQSVSLSFDYPELIRISTWDLNEVSIQGSVSINEGESDKAFELVKTDGENVLYVENRIRDFKTLPHRLTVVDGGKRLVFRSKEDYRKYAKENGKNFEVMSWGVEMDILLEIKVPKNLLTKIKSVYGVVEVNDFVGPLSVEATYGAIDAALQEKATGELTAETNYGQIYTNLDTKFSGDGFVDKKFHTWVSAKPGTGPAYNFESKYGNVYLRKKVN
jgi:hypothetical protein